jgi:hypothetical protein
LRFNDDTYLHTELHWALVWSRQRFPRTI